MTHLSPLAPQSFEFVKRIPVVLFFLLIVVGSFWVIWIDQHRVVPIIMYHHIDDPKKHPVASVPVDHFEQHLQYLQDYDFEVLALEEYLDAKREGEQLPRKTVVLTFDDGFEDNYTNAFPLLKKYKVPAAMFISTDKVGQPGYVTWEQLKEMAAANITIGSHTIMHEYLPDLSAERVYEEVYQSRRILEEKLQVPIKHFSYPVGGYSPEIKELVRQSGYESAVTTNRGYDRFNHDLYELNRVTMDDEDLVFPVRWAKFSGYYNLFRKYRNPQ